MFQYRVQIVDRSHSPMNNLADYRIISFKQV